MVKNMVRFLELVTQDGGEREVFFSDGTHFDNLDEIENAVENNDNIWQDATVFQTAKQVVKAFNRDKYKRATPAITKKVKDSFFEILTDGGVPDDTAKRMLETRDVFWVG